MTASCNLFSSKSFGKGLLQILGSLIYFDKDAPFSLNKNFLWRLGDMGVFGSSIPLSHDTRFVNCMDLRGDLPGLREHPLSRYDDVGGAHYDSWTAA